MIQILLLVSMRNYKHVIFWKANKNVFNGSDNWKNETFIWN